MSANRKNVYGNDMLYVTTSDGLKVGRTNLKTGKVTMDRHDLRGEFDWFVATWRSTHLDDLAPVPDDPPQPAPLRAPPPPPPARAAGPLTPGVAGSSAQQIYERRSTRELAATQERVTQDAQWRSQIKEDRPVLGRVASAFQASRCFTTG